MSCNDAYFPPSFLPSYVMWYVRRSALSLSRVPCQSLSGKLSTALLKTLPEGTSTFHTHRLSSTTSSILSYLDRSHLLLGNPHSERMLSKSFQLPVSCQAEEFTVSGRRHLGHTEESGVLVKPPPQKSNSEVRNV